MNSQSRENHARYSNWTLTRSIDLAMSANEGPSKKAVNAANAYRQGCSRGAYRLRREISAGLDSNPESRQRKEDGVCCNCKPLFGISSTRLCTLAMI